MRERDGCGTGGRGMERRRRSSYDRTDRSDGPGFPLNSQYMIPGNQNEPAFTTSRGGTFFPNDTIEPQTRASSEETTKALVGALVLKKLRDAADIYIYIHVRTCVSVCDVLYMYAHVRAIVKMSSRRSVPDNTTLKNSPSLLAALPWFPANDLQDWMSFTGSREISIRYRSSSAQCLERYCDSKRDSEIFYLHFHN